MHPKVLIVGTVPYNKKSTSRAFEAYFCNWEKENLAQVFSNTKKPCKGHCGTLFQITDQRMFKRWLNKSVETGVIFNFDDLEIAWENNDLEVDSTAIGHMYRIGSKRTSLTHCLRGLLWRKKYWCTAKLNQWLDAFQPDCVFLSFSDDFFIPQIALYIAKRYNVPIVSSIGDDYFFNTKWSLSPFYHLYKSNYRKLIKKVLNWPGSAIYISDKIRDKYNDAFGMDGETVYLTSEINRRPFRTINTTSPYITYFGNIRAGRNNSLNDIGYALGRINPTYRLHVFSNEDDKSVYGVFEGNPNVIYGGSVPYTVVQQEMQKSDICVIVEGFAKKDVDRTRYSLSTKAADALASGASILTYGSEECGIVEYMQSTRASAVCTDRLKLEDTIRKLLSNTDLQQRYYEQAIIMTQEHHNLESSSAVFENVVRKAIAKKGKKNA